MDKYGKSLAAEVFPGVRVPNFPPARPRTRQAAISAAVEAISAMGRGAATPIREAGLAKTSMTLGWLIRDSKERTRRLRQLDERLSGVGL